MWRFQCDSGAIMKKWSLLLPILMFPISGYGFNVDTGNAQIYQGTSGSDFGFSVKFAGPERLVVGAPRKRWDNRDMYTDILDSTPGVVYTCHASPGMYARAGGGTAGVGVEELCEEMELDPHVDKYERVMDGEKSIENTETQTYQKLGWTLATTNTPAMHNQTVLACGPHWLNEQVTRETVGALVGNVSHRVNGACVLDTPPLAAVTLSPPSGDQQQQNQPWPSASKQYVPLRDYDMQFRVYRVRGVDYKERIFDKALGGFDTDLVMNDEILESFVAGAPGLWDFAGGVIEQQAAGGRVLYLPTYTHQQVPDLHTAYAGYSVETARLFNDDVYLIVGAPRANKVFIVRRWVSGSADAGSCPPPTPFTSHETHRCTNYCRMIQSHNLAASELPACADFDREGSTILTSSEFGSYFGGDVEAVDVNGDGLLDVLVGAPQYHYEGRESGAVYVYINYGHELSSEPHTVLYGGRSNGGRFGTSISGAGDVNKDGLQDVVIGAPFEDEGRGVVYLYTGSQEGLSEDRKQRIPAHQVDPHLTGFGLSICGGVDVDNNGYPDLGVGAYSSSRAVVLLSRPVVTLQPTVTTEPGYTDFQCPNDGDVLRMNVVIVWEAQGEALPDQVRITYNLTVDIGMAKSRGYIDQSSRCISSELNLTRCSTRDEKGGDFNDDTSMIQTTQNAVIPGRGYFTAHHCIAFYVNPLRTSMQDVHTNVTLGLSYALQQPDESSDAAQLDLYPALNTLVDNTIQYEIPMRHHCGQDRQCAPDLILHAEVMTPNDQGYLIAGSTDDFTISIEIRNDGELAFGTRLRVELPADLEHVRLVSEEERLRCPTDTQGASINALLCDVANPLLGLAAKSLTLTLQPLWQQLHAYTHHSIQLTVQAANQNRTADTTATLNVPILYDATLMINSVATPANISFTPADLPVVSPSSSHTPNTPATTPASASSDRRHIEHIQHVYDILNTGPGVALAPRIVVMVPQLYSVITNETTVPGVKLKTDTGSLVPCEPSPSNHSDVTRWACTDASTVPALVSHVSTLLPYICRPLRLDAQDRLLMQIETDLNLQDVLPNMVNNTFLYQTRLLFYLGNDTYCKALTTKVHYSSTTGAVPLWIIVLSVLGGLLILTVVCVILKASGFFNRSEKTRAERQKSIYEDFKRQSALRMSKLLEERSYMDGAEDALFHGLTE